jgi:hypothetical protein
MPEKPARRGFVFHLPVSGIVDRKTLSHNGIVAALRTALHPETKEPFILLFTERPLAKRYIRTRQLAGSFVLPLEPKGVLRALLLEFVRTGIRRAAIDFATTTGHKWRSVPISKIVSAIDAKPRRRR